MMGMDSSKSRPLPWGTPSMMSMRTTSPNSAAAIQCAAVAPTFPDPTTVTFLRIIPVAFRKDVAGAATGAACRTYENQSCYTENKKRSAQGTQSSLLLCDLCADLSFVHP